MRFHPSGLILACFAYNYPQRSHQLAAICNDRYESYSFIANFKYLRGAEIIYSSGSRAIISRSHVCKIEIVYMGHVNLKTYNFPHIETSCKEACYRKFCLLVHNAMQPCESKPMFRRIIPPPSSESKSKPNKPLARRGQEVELCLLPASCRFVTWHAFRTWR
jgi:hypothetical protein